MSEKPDIFLSHNSKDKPIVCEIASTLEAKGIKVWLDKWQLIPGRLWQKSIEKAIDEAKSVAIMIGSDGLGHWEEAEMLASIFLSIEKGIPVIPVLLPSAPPEIRLPLFLRNFGWVDLRAGLSDDGINQLISGITGQPASSLPYVPATQGNTYGNSQGVATGRLVTRRADITSIYKATGSKVILYDTNPTTIPGSIPTQEIAAIMTPMRLPDNNHFMMWAVENNLPVISGVTLSDGDYLSQSKITADSQTGYIQKHITFSAEFINNAQREYQRSVDTYSASGTPTPAPLLDLFALGIKRSAQQKDFVSWAKAWGMVECVARVALPLVAKIDFDYAKSICTSLCSEYQWPVGCDNARRVLPQIAYWHKDDTVQLLKKWTQSGNVHLIKSACMAVATIAILSWETATEMLELAIAHSELTICKEVARAIPIITSLQPEYGKNLTARCLNIPALAPIAMSYISNSGDPMLGLTLSSIPALLLRSQDDTFRKIEETVSLIKLHGLAVSTLNIARNSIFANLIILYTVDRERTLGILKNLRDFCRDDHIQIDVILAWAWLGRDHPADADIIFSAIDDKLNPEPHKLYNELLARSPS